MSDFLTIVNPFTKKLQFVFVGEGSGDMTKVVYDTNDNGIADKAENVDDGAGNATSASDVKLSNTHRASDGKNHADVLLNNTHRAISTGNPHSVSKAELSLNNVTNDAQLKRASGDIASFTEKGSPVSADLIIIEDSADSNSKKRVQIGNLPGGGGAVDSVNGEIGVVVLDEDDIGAGVTNKKYTDTEKTKLAGVATGAEVNVDTNLSEGSSTETTVDVDSSTGTNATLASASATRAGLLTKAKFDEIVVNNAKVSYDDASAVGLNTTHRGEVTGNPHAVTKTEVSLGNVTDDAQLKRSAGDIDSFTEKGSPIGADLILIEDSADSNNKKKIQISNLPGGGTDADAIHDNVAGEISAITEKGSPANADYVIIEDSADSNNKKKVQLGNLPGASGAVDSVNGETGVVVLDEDDIGAGTTNKKYTDTEKTKLSGIATGAEVNVDTDLSEGTSTETTVDVNSSDGTNATLASASAIRAGLLTKAKFDEIVANTAKVSYDDASTVGLNTTHRGSNGTDHANVALNDTHRASDGKNHSDVVTNNAKETNVSTDLSEGTSTETTVDVNSSDGTNATLASASAIRAGLLTKAKFDEIVANTAKVSYDDASAVGLNTTHRGSNGTDHANVGLNDTHRGVTTGNPHSVTKANVGLTNVPDLNTTDAVTNEHTHANKSILDGDQESFTTVLKDKIDAIVNPMLFKGEINANSDFPTSASVQNGWTYRIATDVTDDDVSKTNTGQSFLSDAEIAWNGTDWTELGYSAVKSVNGETGIVILDSTDISFNVLGSPTYNTTQELFDKIQSSGIIDGGLITDAGTGTINISAIKGVVKTTNSGIGENVTFDLASASGSALTDNAINHILVDYNAGTPQFVISVANTSNGTTIFLVGEVYREGTELDIIQSGMNIQNITSRLQEQHIEESIALHFASGAIVSEAGTRNIAITSGILYAGLNRILTDAINTTGADDFEYYYYNGSAWIESDQSQIDNEQYNNIVSGLATLGNNRYGVHWVYKGVDDRTFVLYGQGNYTLSEAQTAQQPASLPDHVLHIGVLRAKIVVLKSATNFLEIENVADDKFTATTPANHDELGNLQGGIVSEYYHLTTAEHTEATRDATNAQNGLMPTGLKTGYDNAVTHISADGSSHADVATNTAKVSNVSTDLSEGTSTETTVDVNSSDGTNATLVSASATRAGLLTKAKFDEIVANTLKDTNVTTDISEGTSTETTVDVNSSDGTNATLVSASATRAGLLTKAKFDEIVANTAKVSYDDASAVGLNTTHRSSDGTDHSYIDQDVTNGSAPVLDASNFTNIPSSDSIALDATPADTTATGIKTTLVAGENVTFNDICYIKSDGKLWKADASAIATAPATFMALATINADASGSFLANGIVRDDTWAWTVGGLIYLSITAGELTQTAPTATGEIVQILGQATHADRMYFKPELTTIELT